ncbi:MAG: non-homologous end-joining DNA ligase [Gemmatimonadota bacterium]
MNVAGVELTHPDRVLYPDQGITKARLAQYYERVAPLMLPHLAGRPLVLLRCPEGQEQQCFFQRHWTGPVPDTLGTIVVEDLGGSRKPHIVVKDAASIVSLIQYGILEIHVWGAKTANVDLPDRIVFDLDPGPKVSWAKVRSAATRIRGLLEEIGLESWLKTTGGKGLHVVAPIDRRATWDEVGAFARAVAEHLESVDPANFVSKMAKASRQGRIFVDWLRNTRGASAVAAWSTRARPGAPVSMPWLWSRIEDLESGDQFTVATVLGSRLPRTDPWAGMPKARQRLGATMARSLAAAKS